MVKFASAVVEKEVAALVVQIVRIAGEHDYR